MLLKKASVIYEEHVRLPVLLVILHKSDKISAWETAVSHTNIYKETLVLRQLLFCDTDKSFVAKRKFYFRKNRKKNLVIELVVWESLLDPGFSQAVECKFIYSDIIGVG